MTKVFNTKLQTPRRKVLRNNLSNSEILLWLELRNRKINGYKFRRQYSVGRYVIDFYCPSKKLAIEVDGKQHQKKDMKEYDKIRQMFIEHYGINVLRFSTEDVSKKPPEILKQISLVCSPPLQGGAKGR